jgi:hypothetical protein
MRHCSTEFSKLIDKTNHNFLTAGNLPVRRGHKANNSRVKSAMEGPVFRGLAVDGILTMLRLCNFTYVGNGKAVRYII